MKSGFSVFLASLIGLGLSWCGFVLGPVLQLGEGKQTMVLNSSQLYPTQRPGDATLGLQVYRAYGCAACHTFTPVGAKGSIGPNLDKLPQLYSSQSGQGGLEEFIYQSIIDPGSRTVPGFKSNVMPASFGQSLKPKQLADLVAFLAKGS